MKLMSLENIYGIANLFSLLTLTLFIFNLNICSMRLPGALVTGTSLCLT